MMRRWGTRRYWAIWLGVVPLLGWALVRGLGLDDSGPLAPLMSFTPWVAIAALFVVGLAVALQNWAAAMVAAASMAVLSVAVLPRAFGGSEEAPAGAQVLTVLSANVYRGSADLTELVDMVRRMNPDLLAIQELRPGVARRLDSAGIRRILPHSNLLLHADDVPGGRPGMGIYSDLPLRPIPREAGSAMVAAVVTLADGEELRVATVHPITPSVDHVDKWAAELERMPSAGAGNPWLLFGDFKATLDQTQMRQVIDRGYRDAGSVTGRGLEMTWPTNRWTPPLVAIDHVLADERLGIADYGTEDLPGSDHRAIWAEVFLP